MMIPLPVLAPGTPAHAGSVDVSEFFGPVIQGEGANIGAPCFFLRLHHCPTHCPGCDTHYTWDGSEGPKGRIHPKALGECIEEAMAPYPNPLLVVSGGEPLLQYRNADFVRMLTGMPVANLSLSLETSGYVGPVPIEQRGNGEDHMEDLDTFLSVFDVIHYSPKITPCLHGDASDKDLLNNAHAIIQNVPPSRLFLKFVVRDMADLDAVDAFARQYQRYLKGRRIYIMPYGMERDEILEVCRKMVEPCAARGYWLTPRLHSLMWGKARGV